MNKTFRDIPKTEISAINNSNTFRSNNDNQKHIIFNPIVRNASYSSYRRNNIINYNTLKNESNYSSNS